MDFLFPPFCVACNKQGDWWCDDCRLSVQHLSGSICPKCLRVIDAGRLGRVTCDECYGSLPFNRVWSFGYYHDPKLRAAITALKFQGTTALHRDLRSFLYDKLPSDLPGGAVLIPMPLSGKRLKERGFNQAEIIANEINDAQREACIAKRQTSGSTDCCFESRVPRFELSRVGHREAQSSMSHDLDTRQENVKNCFQVVGDVPKNVILVDDVITTGATAAEAAKALLSAGAEKVSVLTLAIGA